METRCPSGQSTTHCIDIFHNFDDKTMPFEDSIGWISTVFGFGQRQIREMMKSSELGT